MRKSRMTLSVFGIVYDDVFCPKCREWIAERERRKCERKQERTRKAMIEKIMRE